MRLNAHSFAFIRLACKRDLEGTVAKPRFDPSLLDNTKRYKIRKRNYSQWMG